MKISIFKCNNVALLTTVINFKNWMMTARETHKIKV